MLIQRGFACNREPRRRHVGENRAEHPRRMKMLVEGARRAGPYVMVELLMPGGTLVVLGMLAWANRRRLAERLLKSRR
jgi:hypothetical protein